MNQPPPIVPPQPQGPAHSPTQPRVCGFAIASLICALLPIPLVGAILAIVFSIKSRRRIVRSQGALSGQGLALAGMICGIVFGGISLIAVLAGIALPVIVETKKKGDRSQAIGNAKAIGLTMFNFEQDYGTFPGPATIPQVQRVSHDRTLVLGTQFSNDYFRQLIAAGHSDTEMIFYATTPYTRKPDNNMEGENCLAAGEVGFAYITPTGNKSLSSKGDSGRPLIVAATLDAAADGTFDPKVYQGYAVVLRIDQSVTAMKIRMPAKKLPIGKQHTLLETGPDTVWGTDETPVIHPPQPLRR